MKAIEDDMTRRAFPSAKVAATAAVIPIILFLQGTPHAQTIDSQDTRTFQDNRGQDARHDPGPIPPSAAELMKRLNEGKDPDRTEQSEPSEPSKRNDDDTKAKVEKPQAPPSPGN